MKLFVLVFTLTLKAAWNPTQVLKPLTSHYGIKAQMAHADYFAAQVLNETDLQSISQCSVMY